MTTQDYGCHSGVAEGYRPPQADLERPLCGKSEELVGGLLLAGQRPSQPDPFPTFATAESGRRKCPPASRLDRPRIIAAEFVRPFRLSGKNDADDAEAVCTAVREAKLRFVSIKSVDQQAVLGLHRIRRGFIEERTAAINRLRGFWRSSES